MAIRLVYDLRLFDRESAGSAPYLRRRLPSRCLHAFWLRGGLDRGFQAGVRQALQEGENELIQQDMLSEAEWRLFAA